MKSCRGGRTRIWYEGLGAADCSEQKKSTRATRGDSAPNTELWMANRMATTRMQAQRQMQMQTTTEDEGEDEDKGKDEDESRLGHGTVA
jgi:hypothetical protein